jgi:hypothetical protein
MTWQEGVGVVLVCIGLLAGMFVAAQRPAFWVEFGGRVIKAFMPKFIAYVTKRMPPEKEKEWRDCIRRGGEWDHIRKRCKR